MISHSQAMRGVTRVSVTLRRRAPGRTLGAQAHPRAAARAYLATRAGRQSQ